MGCCCSKKKDNKYITTMKKETNVKKILYNGADTYTISHTLLGKGHYGKVYKALLNNKEKRAIKIIPKIKFKKNEKASLELVSFYPHNNIIYLYSVIVTKQYYYIISDEYSGGELFDKIKSTTFTEKEAYYIIRQLLLAVKHLHKIGIVHRDIKPENIIISDTHHIRLIDFGLAKIESEIIHIKNKCRYWRCVGTPYYQAPEVIKKYYSELCDEWSVGIVYHILIVQYPPYNASTDAEITIKVKNNQKYYNENDWLTTSSITTIIIDNLLNVDVDKRWSAEYILENHMNSPEYMFVTI